MSEANTNTTILDLDALMDTQMDSIETLPDYAQLSDGFYRLKVKKCEINKGKDKKTGAPKNSIQLTYELVSTKQSKEPPYPDGSLVTDRFQATEEGLKYFKKKAMNILNVADLGKASMRDIMDGLVGEEFDASATVKTTTGEDGKSYDNVNIRALHETAPQ